MPRGLILPHAGPRPEGPKVGASRGLSPRANAAGEPKEGRERLRGDEAWGRGAPGRPRVGRLPSQQAEDGDAPRVSEWGWESGRPPRAGAAAGEESAARGGPLCWGTPPERRPHPSSPPRSSPGAGGRGRGLGPLRAGAWSRRLLPLGGPGVPGPRGHMSPAPDHDYLHGCVFFFQIEHHGLISSSPHASV